MKTSWIYKIFAGIYDIVIDGFYFKNYDKSPRKQVIGRIRNGDRVLDICTGTGINAIKIAKRRPACNVIGIDISKDMLRIAKNKAEKEKMKNLKLAYMDAQNLKFKEETFDKILISLVLHEMEEECARAILSEAKRVLKKDGELIITEWEKKKSWYQKILFLPVHLLEPKTYREFINKDMKKYFENFGLKLEKTIYCDYTKVMIIKQDYQKMS
ncbi:MAG: class I SAM-dependent methyltransferase [Lachnospiraceae bacterium]|nr:class I SAM-dependent methyltransferase [Lachnospiraceae bacterium]